MRKSALILLLLLVAATGKTQTFYETLQWLNSKIVPLRTIESESLDKQYFEIKQLLGCDCQVNNFTYSFEKFKFERTHDFVFSFSDLNPQSLEIFEREKGQVYLRFFTTNNAKVIKQRQVDFPDYYQSTLAFGPYDPKNLPKGLLERIQKAFAHAIEICGGKAEQF